MKSLTQQLKGKGTSKGTRAKLSNIERAAGRVKSKSPRNKGIGKKN